MPPDNMTITPELLCQAYLVEVENVMPGTVFTPIQKVLLEEVCEGAIEFVPHEDGPPAMDAYLLAVARAFELGQAMLLENVARAFEGSDADRVTISYRDQAFTFNRSILGGE